MDEFFPLQRWTSEAEPELGLGIVTETSKRRVSIWFPLAGEMRLYATENAPLRRMQFKVGELIVDAEDRPLRIESIEKREGLLIYLGEGRILPESEIGNMAVKHGAEARLLMGEVAAPRDFSLRRRSLQHQHERRSASISGLVGGRIDLIPHQLYIAHEVSQRFAPRVLLSDEVGLGKTIEACLILHRLLLRGRISRVLIIVPDSLVHQWFVEVLRRFNLWFHIFDEARCRAIEEGAPEGNPFLADQLVLCSTSFLRRNGNRVRQALAAGWDMLVVDEAHHLQWSLEQASPEYSIVELLSKVAKGLLLLTATPEQLGLESHFARLRLLDPERYADFQAFQVESQHTQQAAQVAGKLIEGRVLGSEDKVLLSALVGEERIADWDPGKAEAQDELIQDLLDKYGPGRVVFRNTRASMTGFPLRQAVLAPIKADQGTDWVRQVSEELGLGESKEKPNYAFENDVRVDWLFELLEKIAPEKVLLICQTKEKVLALERAMRQQSNLKLGVFHESLSLVIRDRNAAWFAAPQGARLLICSEIGSEGRNFQFAHHLVLFDLPLNPELLEQRIGRLDRIGQEHDLQIHVPYIGGSAQEILVRWYHEGLNAFEHNLVGGNHLLRTFGDRLTALLQSPFDPETESEVNLLITETQEYQTRLVERLAGGRDRLLEMNSFRHDVAEELVAEIRKEDRDPSLERYMLEVFDHFTIDVEDLDPRTYRLQALHGSTGAFPGIPDEGITVTFGRKRALSREEISFLSWDHPMILGALELVLGSGTGSAAFGVLPAQDSPGILLELIYVLEAVGPGSQEADRYLSSTPLRIVVDHRGNNVSANYPIDMLDGQLLPHPVEDLLTNETLVETILPNMIEAGTRFAEEEAEFEIRIGLRRMQRALNYEIERLKRLQRQNDHIRPEEIENAVRLREGLTSLIESAQVRLDMVQMIQLQP